MSIPYHLLFDADANVPARALVTIEELDELAIGTLTPDVIHICK